MKYRALFLTLFLWVQVALAQPHAKLSGAGPIRLRNQFPISQVFLGFSAEPAWLPGKHALYLSLAYSRANTFVKSGNVVTRVAANGLRRALTAEEIQQIITRNPGEDAFLFDLESERWTLRASWGVSDALALDVELPIVNYGGGVLDPVIENFHSTFGLPNDNRPVFSRNISQAFLYVDGQTLFQQTSRFDGPGFGDLGLAAKMRVLNGKGLRPVVAVKAAVKLPTGSYRKLHGSGSLDVGFNVVASNAFMGNRLHVNFGVVLPGKWKALPGLELEPIYSALFAYERQLGQNSALIIQDFFYKSALRQATTAALVKDSHEISLGARFGAPRQFQWTIAVTENYQNFSNSPDIGFNLGLQRVLQF